MPWETTQEEVISFWFWEQMVKRHFRIQSEREREGNIGQRNGWWRENQKGWTDTSEKIQLLGWNYFITRLEVMLWNRSGTDFLGRCFLVGWNPTPQNYNPGRDHQFCKFWENKNTNQPGGGYGGGPGCLKDVYVALSLKKKKVETWVWYSSNIKESNSNKISSRKNKSNLARKTRQSGTKRNLNLKDNSERKQ